MKIKTSVIRLAILAWLSAISPANGADDLEYKIKAAYLYNFTKFISWPTPPSSTFNLCLVGNDPFQDALDSLEHKKALDKPIRIFRYDQAKQVKDCHIIYFDNPSSASNIGQSNALLVASLNPDGGDQAFFSQAGGMIGFALEQDKVKLRINLKALKQSGLSISAKLIEVSTLVDGD